MPGTEILVTVGGTALIAALAFFFFGPKEARRAEVRDGLQQVEIKVKGGYSPSIIRAQQGVPLRLVFDRQERGECTSEVSEAMVDLLGEISAEEHAAGRPLLSAVVVRNDPELPIPGPGFYWLAKQLGSMTDKMTEVDYWKAEFRLVCQYTWP
jgi:hypothetical protein